MAKIHENLRRWFVINIVVSGNKHKDRARFVVAVNLCAIMPFDSNIFDSLESNDPKEVERSKAQMKEQFNATREPWIMNGTIDYFLAKSSIRAVDVIVTVKEPHDKHFLDRSCEGIKSGNNRIMLLTLLGHVVRKRPMWLFKISTHPLLRELLRLMINCSFQTADDIVTVVSALLILNILLPIIPGLLVPHLQEIFAVFSKLAAMNANSNHHEAQLVHLQISLYSLFHRLYGMFPCNFISYLRKTYSHSQSAFPVFSHTVKPMLDTVRVNPLLISADENWEIQPERWKNVEPHDIIVSCAKLLMNSQTTGNGVFGHDPKSGFNLSEMLGGLKVTGKQSVADYCNELSKKSGDSALWSPSARYFNSKKHLESTPTMIPLTPNTRAFEVSSPYGEPEGSSPPEAAIEATPETTPSRDYVVRPAAITKIPNHTLSLFSSDELPLQVTVPTSDRKTPNSPIGRETQLFRFLQPEIIPNLTTSMPFTKINKLINERQEVGQTSNDAIIEAKPRTVTNDLISDSLADCHDMISTPSTSTVAFVNFAAPSAKILTATSDSKERKSNGTNENESKYFNDDSRPMDGSSETNGTTSDTNSVEDLDTCGQEGGHSGSPCSSGGLHMPDNRSLRDFVSQMTRIRHQSQCQSESGGFSSGTSPQDMPSYMNDAKVRRTNSCPEMKKNSPSCSFMLPSSRRPGKATLPEEKDEDNEEDVAPCVRKSETNGIRYSSKKLRRMGATCEKIDSSSQTEDIPLYPYEHLFLDVFPPLCPTTNASYDRVSPTGSDNSLEERTTQSVYERAYSPSKILQKYIDASVQCHTDGTRASGKTFAYDPEFLANQLKLLSVQLQFEEHRREMHAERNRRLFGRARRNKTLEEHNNALLDQVLRLQQESEKCSCDFQKILAIKENHIDREKKAAVYWSQKSTELQTEHKRISDRCQEIEAQLREEKRMNEKYTKIIRESKAALSDVTNELSTCQKEAKVAKDLRYLVAKLQADILKGGEMMIRQRRQMVEMAKSNAESSHHELTHLAYVEEVSKLKEVLNMQVASLDATKALVADLREELKNKENRFVELEETAEKVKANYSKEIKELKEKYEGMKASYNREVERSSELDYKLNNAKRVSKLQNAPRPYVTSSVVAPDPKTSIDFDQQKLKRMPSTSKEESNAAATVSDVGRFRSKVHVGKAEKFESFALEGRQSSQGGVGLANEKGANVVDSLTSTAGLVDESSSRQFATKKKGRMECAESGQLKSSSISAEK